VGLAVALRNYGEFAEAVTVELESADPLITVHQGVDAIGDMNAGGTANASFAIEAGEATPIGHVADLTLRAIDSVGEQVSEFTLYVGRWDFAIWDPTPDQSSGPVLASALASVGYAGGTLKSLPSGLVNSYRTLFVSTGVSLNNYLIERNSAEAFAIETYLEAGGRVYLEGADVWLFDPLSTGHDFSAMFGVDPYDDGTSDISPVVGGSGTLAHGMQFEYSGEDSYIDRMNAVAPARIVFYNKGPAYGCGGSYDAGVYRTVASSFEFAGLDDGTPPSTKADLARAIMEFFTPQPVSVEDAIAAGADPRLSVYPTPFNPRLTIRVDLPEASDARLAIHDVGGRLVRVLDGESPAAGPQTLSWDGRDATGRRLASGVYFVRLVGDGLSMSRTVVMAR